MNNSLNNSPQSLLSFLKSQQAGYEDELFSIIESAKSGMYFIEDDQINFSDSAKTLFQIEDNGSASDFYQHIHTQDKLYLMSMIKASQNNQTAYEATYRYQMRDEQYLWIREHGIFSFERKNQRLAMVTNVTKQIEQDKKMHHLAFYDVPTHLKNRNFLIQDGQFLIQYQIPFTIMAIDVNRFKVINDQLGSAFYDEIMRLFANRLVAILKDKYECEIYSVYGDDFVIVVPYIQAQKEIGQIADKLILELKKPFVIGDLTFNLSPIIGSSTHPRDGGELEELINYANIALAKAKKEAYFQYCIFEPYMHDDLKVDHVIENHIKSMIKEEGIALNYQPIYDVNQNKIVAYEALLNNTKAFTTDKIFDTALNSDLIVQLDQYIIDKVIRDLSMVIEVIPDYIHFTINLSPKTLNFLDVYDYIKTQLEKYHVNGKRIGIEITEHYLVENEQVFNELIVKLQSLGVSVYLDDFGMGYSSIRNLVFLNYDHIKIDKRIIQSMKEGNRSERLVQHILNFANEMKCDLIFEGIETIEQIEFVRSVGGSLIQGYYISKPTGLIDAIQLLEKTYL